MNIQAIFNNEFYTLANQLVPFYLEKEGYALDLDYLQMKRLNEASQFWIVSDWIAGKFQEKGELILEILDFNIWCRTGCGYSVLIDIEEIMKRKEYSDEMCILKVHEYAENNTVKDIEGNKLNEDQIDIFDECENFIIVDEDEAYGLFEEGELIILIYDRFVWCN